MKSIEFVFPERDLYPEYPMLESIGWERRTGKLKYFQPCRKASEHKCVFQYTVSGEGFLEINNKIYSLQPGQAFLIEKPGSYDYWLPATSSHWEFKFLTITLSSIHYWNKITEKYGHVVSLSKSSSVLAYWNKLYNMTINNEISDIHLASAYAYTFLMHLHDSLEKENIKSKMNIIVQECLDRIHTEYATDIDLDRLCSFVGVSRFYLIKVFRETMGQTPMQYLMNHRLQIACSELMRTSLRINEIAEKCGFVNTNYFSVLFRKQVGMQPSEYRKQKQEISKKNVGNTRVKYLEVDLSKEYE